MQNYLKEIKLLKPYIITVIIVLVLSYSVYFLCGDALVKVLGQEDGFFEWLTAIFFLVASILCFIIYRRTKNLFVLGLALLFFMGMGEEISWGQRIIGFDTPKSLEKVNGQGEFNIHNIEIFNDEYLNGKKKTGWERLLEINMLFRIFSLTFCILIPLFFFHIKPRLKVNKKIQMPVAPVSVGIFFIISWCIFYSLEQYYIHIGKDPLYYLTVGEVFEFTTSFIFFLIMLYFYRDKKDGFLGRDIKQGM